MTVLQSETTLGTCFGIPHVGWGAQSAPSVDAARPKPPYGGSEAATRVNPRLNTLAIWDQFKMTGTMGATFVGRERDGRDGEGTEERDGGEDYDADAELVEVDLEEDAVLQQPEHPWTVIMLVYSLD